ncbi:hypothetical protein AEAC466_05195 [Asticcacaulis sp. AC466]|uniref:trehalose-phosphatase n=1 Tax=Asticcacaulis sp. AC466 TaxID=1282362 RepID=UPI0003C3D068|nr:trehalose-phosphatase [Asticcacaulis sp. AC466]ESQ85107.1 hypothetical protein AEAC466_05195 [Asticcacaulis sp. AC466]
MTMTQKARHFHLDQISLFIDLDGTLAPFQLTPDVVGPDVKRNALLREMGMRLNGRMAVVSGRSIADLDRILEGTIVAMAGSHGLQRRDARLDLVTASPHSGLADAIREIKNFALKFPDVVIEEKPLSVAFHYRQNPSVETVARVFCEDLAQRTGLKWQRGAMVEEFLTPGMDKGRAVRAFMVEPPFLGTTPIFVGDDLTDENGFQAVQALGGFGVCVGAVRDTHAQFQLESVSAVHAWLRQGLQNNYFSLEAEVEPSYSRI